MANALYAKGKQNILDGNIDFSADSIKAVLLDGADYTPNLSTDDALDDVPGAAIVGTAVALASKTITDGVFDAADTTLTAVTGDQAEYVLLYKDSGVSSTSWLIALFDTATGLPVTPNGGDVQIQWAGTADRIFRI
jgi:hypothetical protein